MQRKCRQTGQPFEITNDDIEFLCKVGVLAEEEKMRALSGEEVAGLPTLCPEERSRRRIIWRNERSLYPRKCDLCGKATLSMFAPDNDRKQYCTACIFGDKWDPLAYGQELDFSQPVFSQIDTLLHKVPERALAVSTDMENSDFCNLAGGLKNCYWLFNSNSSEQCLYGKRTENSFDCVDCYKVLYCEACYECINSVKCAFSTYLIDCEGCNDCHYGRDLIGCHYCFGCTNLRNKEYFFFNEKKTKVEYDELVAKIKMAKTPAEIFMQYQEFSLQFPRKYMVGRQNENCTGNAIDNCKDCETCFDCVGLEKAKYCTNLKGGSTNYDSMDVDFYGLGVNQCYDSILVGGEAYHCLFCSVCWVNASDLIYCRNCENGCHDCFGCAGLLKKSYCILNKQYTKEQYEELLPKIIAYMKKTGEWGEFFPIEMCPFAYNESSVIQYRPLSKEEVLARGWRWREPSDTLPKVEKTIEDASLLPSRIEDIPDDILNWAIKCEVSGRPFMIQKIELAFYRKMGLPVPHKHPETRYAERIKLLNPYKFFHRKCDKCGVEFDTTYAPERPEIIYCEQCYRECVE